MTLANSTILTGRKTERQTETKRKAQKIKVLRKVDITSRPLYLNAEKTSSAKDLSHVPCKFFKVGSCTAGSSCPFSHTMQEPGGQKDVCAWFVKGNCKFGHKCALAHVLPGQSMAMDRKNKKAAQVAASAGGNNSGGGKDGSKGGRGQKREGPPNTGAGDSTSGSNAPARNPLLSGSTAPTRVLPTSSRPPLSMPLKATISPSAPAPPLKDTDFASFGLPNENNKLSTAPAQVKPSTQSSSLDTVATTPDTSDPGSVVVIQESLTSKSPPSPLPLSTPSAPRRLGMAQQRSSGSVDFGPIGSPPRSSPSAGQPSRINGFSPGTSPSQGAGHVSSSPFSAPGSQSVFISYDDVGSSTDFKARSGLAASLGAARTWNTDFGPVPSQVTNRSELSSKYAGTELAVEDEDLEEFLPSSLTDLLTPEERSRRMSRTNSSHKTDTTGGRDSSQRPNVEGAHHRYSRSVPAPSLLGDIRSIWADTGGGLPASPDTGVAAGTSGLGIPVGLGSGTPSSYKSSSTFGGRSFGEDPHSPSLLSPSNASAAFLPGLHHHYLNSKNGVQRSATNLRNTGSTLHPPAGPGSVTPNTLSANTFISGGSNSIALSPPHMNMFGSRPPFDAPSSETYFPPAPLRPPSGRPIPGGNDAFGADVDERRNALSPSARALQAHAPGQSLPQGLAAGYSRIHALPPPPSIPSPSATGAFSAGQTAYSPNTNGHEWPGSVIGVPDLSSQAPLQGMGASSTSSGLEAMFSRLSYSAAASRPPSNLSSNMVPSPPSTGTAQSPSGVAATGMVRNVSGRSWQSQGPLSPLSGPVVTGDDDDLFSMDG